MRRDGEREREIWSILRVPKPSEQLALVSKQAMKERSKLAAIWSMASRIAN